MAYSSANDDGFITPIFGVLAIALAMVALAYLQLAKTDERAARRDWERFQEGAAADGVVNLAAWQIMHQPGSPLVTWVEKTSVGPMRVTVEPEMRKLSLNELSSPRGFEKLSKLVGGTEASDIARRALEMPGGQTRIPARADVRQLSTNKAWTECGLTLVSPLSRLTDNALETRERSQEEFSFREGEAWRVSVASKGRPIVDRVVRFTGDRHAPIAVIDVLIAPGLKFPEGCAAKFKESGSTRDES